MECQQHPDNSLPATTTSLIIQEGKNTNELLQKKGGTFICTPFTNEGFGLALFWNDDEKYQLICIQELPLLSYLFSINQFKFTYRKMVSHAWSPNPSLVEKCDFDL